VDAARDWAVRHGQHEVNCVSIPWDKIPGNPLPEGTYCGERKRSHAAIVGAIRYALQAARVMWPEPDVICFLEHDVLYPPDYFVAVGNAFGSRPSANVVSNLDYIGLSADGWQPVKERHEPLHQLSMRAEFALANLDRASADCERQGWALLEPQGDRKDWVRFGATPGLGVMPAVHVNHTSGRFTSHGDVCYGPASTTSHPHWGDHSRWWA
jgi:hypothetical protein